MEKKIQKNLRIATAFLLGISNISIADTMTITCPSDSHVPLCAGDMGSCAVKCAVFTNKGNTTTCSFPGDEVNAIYGSCNSHDQGTNTPLPEVTCEAEVTPYPDNAFVGWIVDQYTYDGTPYAGCGSDHINPAPPMISCTANNLTIDYGDIPPSSFVNKLSKSATTTINCSEPASANITISNPTLSFSNGGLANLTIDDSGTNTTDVYINTSSSIKITSTLTGNSTVKTGPFSGSSTIIISVE